MDAFRVIGQEPRDDTHRVQGAECTAGFRKHVAPEQQREEALLGRVEEVPEVATILVPASARIDTLATDRERREWGWQG